MHPYNGLSWFIMPCKIFAMPEDFIHRINEEI